MSKEMLSGSNVSRERCAQGCDFGAMEPPWLWQRRRSTAKAGVRVAIDRETGEYETFRTWVVVDFDNLDEEEEPNPGANYSGEEAREIEADAESLMCSKTK